MTKMAFPTPRDCFIGAIERWENKGQAEPNRIERDKPRARSTEVRRPEITLGVAADIAVKLFYIGPHFDRLTWSPLVEIAVDIGWSAGPCRAIKMLQQLVGAIVDGSIGPRTTAAVDSYLDAHDIGNVCNALSEARAQFHLGLGNPEAGNADWLKRVKWYRTDNAAWWSQWRGWTRSAPATPAKPLDFVA